ncbi:MAG TPA: hypothetical protein VM778_09230 [Gemmatimonadota bacterium]|nr:hypothetical protein [Gemmatimonadota bacterium]
MRPRTRLMIAVAALMAGAAPAFPQGASIDALERVARQREGQIAALETRLRTYSAQQDSLVRAKSRARGSARYEEFSNRIRENSERIVPVQRDLTNHYEQLRRLKNELLQRYNVEIGLATTRYDVLKAEGRTTRNSVEMRALSGRIQTMIERRLALSTELEQIQEDLYLPELVYLPDDSPRALVRKEALALDAVAEIRTRLASIENLIENENRQRRMEQEVARLQRDLELWGDDQGQGDEFEQMLEQQPGRASGGQDNPFGESPQQRMRRLQQRRLELRDRLAEYQQKADLFAQAQREFYP